MNLLYVRFAIMANTCVFQIYGFMTSSNDQGGGVALGRLQGLRIRV